MGLVESFLGRIMTTKELVRMTLRQTQGSLTVCWLVAVYGQFVVVEQKRGMRMSLRVPEPAEESPQHPRQPSYSDWRRDGGREGTGGGGVRRSTKTTQGHQTCGGRMTGRGGERDRQGGGEGVVTGLTVTYIHTHSEY